MFRAVGLSTHVWNNFIRSALLLAGFPLLLMVLSFGIAMVFAAGADTVGQGFLVAWHHLPAYFGGAVVVSLVWFAIAWMANQTIIDAVSGAREISRESDRRLWDVMETLCIARGETMPRLAMIDSSARNAFASGLQRRRGSITVTRGLVDALDDRELSAVLAHELTHIRNGDARLAVVAAVFTGIITLGFDLLWRRGASVAGQGSGGTTWGGRRGRSSSSDNGGLNAAVLVIGLVIVVLAGVLSVALRLALSRNREYLADAGSVQITGDADAMISALRKIEGRAEMPLPSQVQAMLLEHAEGQKGGGFWATHPPIGARIDALVRLAGGRDPGPLPEAGTAEAGTAQAGTAEAGTAEAGQQSAATEADVAPHPAAHVPPASPWGRNLPIPGLVLPSILPGIVPPAAAASAAAAPPSFSSELEALRAKRPPEA